MEKNVVEKAHKRNAHVHYCSSRAEESKVMESLSVSPLLGWKDVVRKKLEMVIDCGEKNEKGREEVKHDMMGFKKRVW